MFNGIITALITPFRDEKIDEAAFADLVNWQIEQGVTGLVACGTTGEGMLLSHEEHRQLLEICVKVSGGRAKVLAGTGVVSTEETLALTQQAEDCGVDGALIITPWYVRPNQDSLFEHYRKIHDQTNIPLLLYNNPVRTGVNLEVETIVKLSQLKRVEGLKDASSDLGRVQELRTSVGDEFSLMAGDDSLYVPHLSVGGDGVISSSANAAPKLFIAIQKAWESGDLYGFEQARDALYPFIKAMGIASNPQPIKFAASLLGNITLETRLPFEPLNSDECEIIRNTLKAVGAWNEQPSLTVAPA